MCKVQTIHCLLSCTAASAPSCPASLAFIKLHTWQDVPEGTLLLSIPMRLAISDRPDQATSPVGPDTPSHLRLASKLLSGIKAGSASPWHKYLQVPIKPERERFAGSQCSNKDDCTSTWYAHKFVSTSFYDLCIQGRFSKFPVPCTGSLQRVCNIPHQPLL